MFKISEHILEEIDGKSIKINSLDDCEKEKILTGIEKYFIEGKMKDFFIWEQLKNYSCKQDDKAWSYLKDFVKKEKCIMFFNKCDEKEMFEIKTGDDLHFILSETYGFEFYLTNRECSYLLCFNHHDILYGCGTAKKWVEKL